MKIHSSRWIFKAGVVSFAASLLFLVPRVSLADSVDWMVVGGGSVSYAGGASPLHGTGITVTSVMDVQTTANVDILNGILTFTTGNFTGNTSTQWFFGANSSPTAITITGCIDNDNDGGACDAQDTPVSLHGKIDDAAVSKASVGASFATVLFDLSDVINSPSVCTALGASLASCGPGTGGGNMLLQLGSGVIPPNGFTATRVLSGDIFSGPSVPEPTTLLFAAFSVLGIAWLARRKKFGSAAI
jgi:hypothetical protein